MKKTKTVLALVLAILSFASFASFAKSLFNYDYIGVEFGSTEVDGYSGSFNFTGVSSSLSINDTYYISLSSVKDRENAVDISLSSYGIGSHHTLSDTTDLVIDASIIDVKVGSSSSDGVGIQLGTIYRINEYFSILVGINYIKMEGESDSEFAFGTAYVMPINKELSLGASIAIVDDASTTSVGLEYTF